MCLHVTKRHDKHRCENIEFAFLNIWVITILKHKLLFGEKCLYLYTLERENLSKCVEQVDYLMIYFSGAESNVCNSSSSAESDLVLL